MGEKVVSEFEFAPLRTLDDFLLESARFQIPNVKDLEKWGNRVCKNLLYYQTNYFLLAVITFIIVGVIHPTKMACGVLVTLIILLTLYLIRDKPRLNHFKRKHPIVSVVLLLSGGYFVTYMLGSLLIFFVGILLPFCIIFIHASLRLRNLRNKITNHVEMLGLKKTPMGIFLEELGMEQF
ncbi:hypothetical protein PPYR_05894 [Photinus pyralis]|uniref:PRA1 family protein n=1 Tax=Photinus pyralis TaxID=7054 RepID=A0A1Y1LPQ8_PHOPY|nr:PRA1 family protein 3 [Photinus pyralis]KAB0801540.1 hypothetical protein PPYR_05894 [Photinus pyralis]